MDGASQAQSNGPDLTDPVPVFFGRTRLDAASSCPPLVHCPRRADGKQAVLEHEADAPMAQGMAHLYSGIELGFTSYHDPAFPG